MLAEPVPHPVAPLRLVTPVIVAPSPQPATPVPPEPTTPPKPKRPHGSALRQQPPRSILTDYQRSGVSWQAVDREAVFTACDALSRAGIEFTDALALMDLHAWIDRQAVKPHRYYAKRWGWGENRTYRFMCDAGVYGDETAKQNQTNAEQTQTKGAAFQPKNADQEASVEQKQTSVEQYPTSLSQSLSREEDTPLPPTGGKPTKPRPPKLTPDTIADAIPLPAALDTDAFRSTWREWIGVRMSMRSKPAKPVAMFTRQLRQLEPLDSDGAIACIDASIAGNWQGLFPEKITNTTNGNRNGAHQQVPRNGRERTAYEQRVALSGGEGLERIQRNLADMAAGRQGPGRTVARNAPRPNGAGSDPDIAGRTPVGRDAGGSPVD